MVLIPPAIRLVAKPAPRVPSVVEAERIAALPDPVLRNLSITQSYSELGRGLAARLGGNASWCALAVWASKQAGQTIRQEDPERLLASFADRDLEAAIERLVRALEGTSWGLDVDEVRRAVYRALGIEDMLARTGAAIAEGNRRVFAEIGVWMARFLETLSHDERHDERRVRRFCEPLLPGPPPTGQGLLRRAMFSYYEALFERRAKRRAELVFLANLDIGVHEQLSLQAVLDDALNAAVVDPLAALRRLLAELHPRLGPFRRLLELYLRWTRPMDDLGRRVLALAASLVRRALTEWVLRLALPTGELLWLGRDLEGQFPPDLRTLADPVLRQALADVDPTPGSSRGTGADDWADFPERMHFIADYFRAYQQEPRIFDPPFSLREVEDIRNGRRPPGWL